MNKPAMSDREKQFLLVGGVVAGLLLLLTLVILPFQDRMKQMDRRIEALEGEWSEAQELQREYLQLKARLTGSEMRLKQSQEKNFSLFQYMQNLARAQAAPEQLVYIRPKPPQVQEEFRISALEARFQNIDLGQAVRLLREIQGADAVLRVKSLNLKKRFDNPELMDLDIVISAYSRIEG